MATPKRSSLGTRLWMRKISVVGRSGCGLSINMKYVGEGMSAAENSGYFLSMLCSRDVEIEGRSVCTGMRGCSSTPARNKSK